VLKNEAGRVQELFTAEFAEAADRNHKSSAFSAPSAVKSFVRALF